MNVLTHSGTGVPAVFQTKHVRYFLVEWQEIWPECSLVVPGNSFAILTAYPSIVHLEPHRTNKLVAPGCPSDVSCIGKGGWWYHSIIRSCPPFARRKSFCSDYMRHSRFLGSHVFIESRHRHFKVWTFPIEVFSTYPDVWLKKRIGISKGIRPIFSSAVRVWSLYILSAW